VVSRATLLMASAGYAAPETEEAFARARALCAALPDDPAIHPVLRGLLSFHHVRAELDEATALGADLLARAAARPDDVALRVQAHYGVGATDFHVGRLADARRHLEAARRDYTPATHAEHVRVYGGYDPGVACAMWLGWTALLQGETDEATRLADEALALARRLPDAFTLAWAAHGVGVSRQLVGDWAGSEQACAEADRLAEEHGFPHVRGMAMANRGLARVMRGEVAAGIAMLREGVAQVERTGAALVRPSYLAMLAAAHGLEGDRDAALARTDEALAEMARTGERTFEAAVLVQKSHLLAARGARGRAAAEDCLRRAVDVARTQGARLLELRAAVALARQADTAARRTEARVVLDAACAPFADRPTPPADVATARRLLGALPGPAAR
jgi:adenylate cyclase